MKNEISLYQRNTEAVMAIENRAREICEPVSSKDTSNLIPNDKTFWPEVEPEITLEPEVISNNNAIEAEDDLFSWASEGDGETIFTVSFQYYRSPYFVKDILIQNPYLSDRPSA